LTLDNRRHEYIRRTTAIKKVIELNNTDL